MVLTVEQVKSILFGAVNVEIEKETVLVPNKCTYKQQEAWGRASEDEGEKMRRFSRAATGVRLDFHTDSEYFAVTTVYGDQFSLLINGKPAEIWKPECERRKYRVELPKGENRVTLIFSNHWRARITDVELSDGAYFRPHEYDFRILFFGDSITEGWEAEYHYNSYAWRLSLSMNADCLIQGISAGPFLPDTVDELPFHPDIIIVAFGTNDYGHHYHDFQVFKSACEETLRRLQSFNPESRIFVVTPLWRADMDEVREVGSFETIRKTIADIATSLQMKVIDGFELVPHEPKWFADEILHPNDEGFRLYAENLEKKLREFMAKDGK